ncbi:DUF2624 domain-containing protein [Lederbergia citrea]|uniref:DUF2624 domain-containing protein n=1 Tax=Lederbergia citrea TaxID=2833581 RepID=A0A942UKN8_9BACI|nr:DUF2624 domain-containing protein [Lederbergia citrea]MBS4176317.1 DUF2624 domain-containing protein [Lederbergia citrea]MBS4202878.1 DUF2624 domain-containing protein [Lederbergia citrea]MBS4222455.1 DUF2624 domain-containing protein [Lederbergia citrea]
MNLIKNMVNYKINVITTDELLKYARDFHIQVTRPQAEKIVAYLRGKNLDIFNDQVRTQIIREVAKIAGPDTAKDLNKLFLQLTK